ncbi:hypothetical protein [Nitrospirillum amazonense]|uniref:hypothetical protein n=1 Tax=Nitrospirillum amazonense TaxID=28077 RepID=UPI0011A5B51F|nr:hypothetical protein [Nitrospirillum amazonense]
MTDLPETKRAPTAKGMLWLVAHVFAVIALVIAVVFLPGLSGSAGNWWWGLLALATIGGFLVRRWSGLGNLIWVLGCLTLMVFTLVARG